MHFQSIVTGVSLLLAGASALPSPHKVETIQPEKRAVGGVYMCTEANWSGNCQYLAYPVDTCVQLSDEWASQVSSFGPDAGTSCMIMQGHCSSSEDFYGDIVSPGYADLSTIEWSDRMTSYLCFAESVTSGNSTLNH
ncbi:hypothetical protein M8818_000062 [Zalaria obscura]|uniref:Uncharacterized protein n=1 Tax=Zalaria obscura TaxID=2024903 RepID=A0ACC3SQ22_9PEZI